MKSNEACSGDLESQLTGSFYLSSPPLLPLPKMGSRLPVSLSFFYPRQGPGCREGMHTKPEAGSQAPVIIPMPKGA